MASRVAARLTREMKRRDWSYREFAEFLDVPISQLHGWVHEAHEPNLSSLRHLAEKLDCSVAELIEAA